MGVDEQAGKMMEGEPVGREERKERKEGRKESWKEEEKR